MKEKLGVVLIVIIATLCLFGCSEELPEEEMVSVSCDTYSL